MKSKKLIRFVESFILLPAITITGSIGSIPGEGPIFPQTPQAVFFQKDNRDIGETLALLPELKLELGYLFTQRTRAEAIDEYFSARAMPLAGMGMKMVKEAEKYNLDWRLLPAIAARESTGGKNACIKVTHNPFGWNSCKTGFESTEEAIEVVAKNLGGKNPKTARYYAGKDTKAILRAYNPPHVIPRYVSQVERIMNTIGEESLGLLLKEGEIS